MAFAFLLLLLPSSSSEIRMTAAGRVLCRSND
jgi:hypothetical protein